MAVMLHHPKINFLIDETIISHFQQLRTICFRISLSFGGRKGSRTPKAFSGSTDFKSAAVANLLALPAFVPVRWCLRMAIWTQNSQIMQCMISAISVDMIQLERYFGIVPF